MGADHARDQIYKALQNLTLSSGPLSERLKGGLWHLNFVINHDHDAESIGEQEWVALRKACEETTALIKQEKDDVILASSALSVLSALLEAYRTIPQIRYIEPL